MTIVIGFLMDLLLGDPQWMPHPVRFIGQYIRFFEKSIRRKEDTSNSSRLKGYLLTITTIGLTFLFYWGLLKVAFTLSPIAGKVVEIFAVYQLLATKCLGFEGMRLYKTLKMRDLEGARKWISYLVSRDTSEMSEEDIVKASIETVSENIIDGIIAPLFFTFLGGVPLGMAYKAANTLDSMVGYKNEQYTDFGFASAKLDDVLNWIPARITGILVVVVAFVLGYDGKNALRVLIRDRKNHASPNSPYGEAPTAGALRIQLGGKATYFGVTSMKPTFGDPIEPLESQHIQKTVRLMYGTAVLGLIIFYGCERWLR